MLTYAGAAAEGSGASAEASVRADETCGLATRTPHSVANLNAHAADADADAAGEPAAQVNF